MAKKTNQIGVRFDIELLDQMKEKGFDTPQKVLNHLTDLAKKQNNTIKIEDLNEEPNKVEPQPTRGTKKSNYTIDTLKHVAEGTEIKPSGLKFKNRPKPLPEKEVENQPENSETPDRPEPPAHLKGIDLSIWKKENWK